MRKRRSQSGLVKIINTTAKIFRFVLLPLVFFYKLSERVSLRKRNAEFALDIADAYQVLITRYRGIVVPEKLTEPGVAFDYVQASLEFADRTFRFVRGRGELSVTCNGSLIFSGDDKGLYHSASLSEEHWSELLEADYKQIQKWLIQKWLIQKWLKTNA